MKDNIVTLSLCIMILIGLDWVGEEITFVEFITMGLVVHLWVISTPSKEDKENEPNNKN